MKGESAEEEGFSLLDRVGMVPDKEAQVRRVHPNRCGCVDGRGDLSSAEHLAEEAVNILCHLVFLLVDHSTKLGPGFERLGLPLSQEVMQELLSIQPAADICHVRLIVF